MADRRDYSELPTSQELVAAVERELRQISELLHDNLCQTLAGTSMLMETIARAAAARQVLSPILAERLRCILENVISQARELSQRFNPANLEGPGLMNALQSLAQTRPHCEFTCEKPVLIHSPETALAVLRISEEAVRNALQHSGADKVCINLKQIGRELTLRVTDNGRGFLVSENRNKISGLSVMRRRAEAIGGRLRVTSKPEHGTTVTCRAPAESKC